MKGNDRVFYKTPTRPPRARRKRKRYAPFVMVLALAALLLFFLPGCQSQPKQQEPDMDRAKQTVTDFLESCKQGQVEEALDNYMNMAPLSPARQDPGLQLWQEVLDYKVFEDVSLDNGYRWGPVLDVNASISTRDVGEVTAQFQVALDGSYIEGESIGYGENVTPPWWPDRG